MDFNNIKELELYVNKRIFEALNNDVAEVIKVVEQRNVEDVVYQGYVTSNLGGQPWRYKRRRTNNGLQDKKNMIHNVKWTADGFVLSIENITTGSRDSFKIADLVEYGDGYNGKEYEWKRNRDGTAEEYLKARPFTKETIRELKTNKEHIYAFKRAMKAKGINLI